MMNVTIYYTIFITYKIHENKMQIINDIKNTRASFERDVVSGGT